MRTSGSTLQLVPENSLTDSTFSQQVYHRSVQHPTGTDASTVIQQRQGLQSSSLYFGKQVQNIKTLRHTEATSPAPPDDVGPKNMTCAMVVATP